MLVIILVCVIFLFWAEDLIVKRIMKREYLDDAISDSKYKFQETAINEMIDRVDNASEDEVTDFWKSQLRENNHSPEIIKFYLFVGSRDLDFQKAIIKEFILNGNSLEKAYDKISQK